MQFPGAAKTERVVNQQDGLKLNAHTHEGALIEVAHQVVLSILSALDGFQTLLCFSSDLRDQVWPITNSDDLHKEQPCL